MGKWRGHRRYGGPWYGIDRQRIIFENGARDQFPSLKGNTNSSGPIAGRMYHVGIDVPFYDTRKVKVVFPKNGPDLARIFADGPTCSPHRYSDQQLCIWHPDDPEENRWVKSDGLLHLLIMIQNHLFREAWYRETGKWCGAEAGHAESSSLCIPPRW